MDTVEWLLCKTLKTLLIQTFFERKLELEMSRLLPPHSLSACLSHVTPPGSTWDSMRPSPRFL